MVKPVAQVNVTPRLPKALESLQELAYNLRWSWHHESIALFRRLDPDLWDATHHNPVWMLGRLNQERLQAVSEDPTFMAHLKRVHDDFQAYMANGNTWYKSAYDELETDPIIAYFSMEFGITECLQNYSGGLGVLSGDHLKSASDLNIPLIGIGLLYQEGYFQQYLNADGWQQESYPINDYANLPVTLQTDDAGQPIKITVPLPGRELYAQIWKVQVGRVSLYLLDSNVPENTRAEDRDLTDRLYGGDRRTRIRQEILMGIGGVRALRALGYNPDIYHLNEGHSAFLLLERIRLLMKEHDINFQQAQEIVRASCVFTVHTPVPAGLERFGYDLIDEHFTNYMSEVGISRDAFLDLGREVINGEELFSMSVMALKMSSGANGVAQLHGVVSRDMWQWMFPDVPTHEVPIEAVTNGIHTATWISNEMATLLDRYFDPRWRDNEADPSLWENIDAIPDAELWRTHERRRERLVAFARKRLQEQLARQGASQSELEAAEEVLNPDTLTIGFARRFATYKRANLVFRDLERIEAILNNTEMPVQLIFAGKAHPHDREGKDLIRQIVEITRKPEFRQRVVFIENYDMNVAHYLVQGVDVWLNNPRRPKEASGTSGMKVIYNGGLNCSIPDGWWAEAYTPEVGWSIGLGEEYPADQATYQDDVESRALYKVLESDIIPLFYDRGRDSLPRNWIAKVKTSMKALAPFFNTRRMVQQYTEDYYMPTYIRYREMTQPNLDNVLAFADWRKNLSNAWQAVEVLEVNVDETAVSVGTKADIIATVKLGTLKPEDVCIQLYYGTLSTWGEIVDGNAIDMAVVDSVSDGVYRFKANVTYEMTGNHGISVRVLPDHAYLPTRFQSNLIKWA